MADHVDTCVIGAGVVGLAIARQLSTLAPDLFVLEQADHYGQGISSRNSEVIHAGIYYAQGSMKSRLCLRGKSLLYDYCEKRNVGFRRCGKLIVATSPDEEETLESILQTAHGNGVDDVTFWSGQTLQEQEPEVRASLALFSPSTGIISAHDLMNAMATDIAAGQGQIVPQTSVVAVTRETGRFLLHCLIGGERYQMTCRVLINAAGLGAQDLAYQADFLNHAQIPRLYLCKGNYFTYAGRNPFNHLIYPVPHESGAGLGVHATLDLGGQVKFGPDVQYVDEEDYSVSSNRLDSYYEAIRRYFPALVKSQLQPGYVGIRPKLQGPNSPVEDFVIQSANEHGVPGYVQLFGIESPGLTSSMAIAEYVEKQLADFY